MEGMSRAMTEEKGTKRIKGTQGTDGPHLNHLSKMARLSHFPRVLRILQGGVDDGLHVGAQIYVSVDGECVLDDGLGLAREGAAMTPETIMLWLSAGKPIGAVLFSIAWERGLLGPGDRAADHVPGFAQNGKGAVTLRHILTHTGGFRAARLGFPKKTWAELIDEVCAMKLEPYAVPGAQAGYHISSSWYILGEILRRTLGKPYPRLAREEIFEPLGAEVWVGMPEETYAANEARIGRMHDAWNGPPRPHQQYTLPEWATGCFPGGCTHATARGIAALYEMLMNGGERDGVRLLRPQTVEAITARHRAGMRDRTFQATVDYGLGFVVNSEFYAPGKTPYGYGQYASPRTFGHGGSQSSTVFCDPERRLVVACVFNGTPGEPRHQRRLRAFCDALYEDLGFTG